MCTPSPANFLSALTPSWQLYPYPEPGFIKIEQLFKKVVQFKNIVLPSV